ncbi:MAG: branched-chain amino acid transport system permease protein livM [Actinomycetota bacterium]|nr:branched-chain amino acid transport system permease protein livM [Actinomycetota bacterium]
MNAVLLNGAFVGLIYGLLGVGLVVVYRGSRIVNFAYGETGMIAAFVFADIRYGTSPAAATVQDHGIWVALPAAIVVGAVVSAATEFVVIRPLRNAPRLRPLVGTFAVGSLLLVFALRHWGADVRFAKPLVAGSGVKVAGLLVQPEQMLILGVTLVILGGFWALYRFTPFGLRLRATALDPYAAGLVGVNVNTTSMATWALAGAVAGVSAVLVAPLVAFNAFFMTLLLLRGLAAALVGGLTSVWGAVIAGVGIGVAEGFVAFKSPVSGITDALIAVFVLALMLVRPTGLVRSAY